MAVSVQAPDAVIAPLDEGACASLLANLMLNAVQHTPAGGSVTVTILAAADVTIEVRDTGRGIAPEDLPHLFERFWRGDNSRARSTGGAGLGLSICKAIVDSCGGDNCGRAARLGRRHVCHGAAAKLMASPTAVRELSAVQSRRWLARFRARVRRG